MQTVWLLIVSSTALYVIRLYVEFRRNVKAIGDCPGYRILLLGPGFLARFLPQIPVSRGRMNIWRSRGRMNLWRSKHKDFEYFGSDIYSVVDIWPKSTCQFRVADPSAIKEITSSRTRFPKPVEAYRVLNFYGDNIIATEGDEWKKHRKVANPAFSERNNRMVWDETVKIVNDMFQNAWRDQKEVVVDHCVDVTLTLALLVIGTAGFGRSISWESDLQIPPGHQMSFKEALHIVSNGMFWKLIVPEWAMEFTQRLRNIKLAFSELQLYMQDMIDERKNAEKKVERYDLFSSLLDASDEESDGFAKLSDSELRGNIFIFMLAGHETTAHTLCFCFALLALYQDEQETLSKHIDSVLTGGRAPTYEDMGTLTYSMAVFYETLRLFPPVNGIPKKCEEDTTLATTTTTGEKLLVALPKGSSISLHIPGLHYNPKYWKDPYEFKPKRFLEDYNRDAFLPFSSGARSCMGRRFFETEGIAILTSIIQKYKIEVKDEPQFANETFDERRERVLACKNGLTLTDFPGYRTVLTGFGFLVAFLPQIPGISQGRMNLWRSKHKGDGFAILELLWSLKRRGLRKDFEYFGSDIYSVVNIWPKSTYQFRVADPSAIKEITSSRTRFPKPVEAYRILKFYGENIIVTEGDEWKRHRKVANPAFSERNNRMVWEETVKIVNDMFQNAWCDQKEVVVDHCVDVTLTLALLVIGTAGFGRSISWESDLQIPPGHQMSFKEALHIVSIGMFWKLILPGWAMGFTQRLRTINLAFSELQLYMQNMIDERKNAEKKVERYDLFSSLLDASEEESDGFAKLSDSELRGNIFIFMLAGHETTAHTLCFCFALLALYQEEQEILFQHINSVLAGGRAPTYEDMSALTYSMAVFYETLRLFPPVTGIPKKCEEDTTVATTTTTGEKLLVAIPKGSSISLHIPGLHYNPRYWKDPHEFKPKRFLEDYNRDAFLPFSSGARSCMGRRFFETEGIAILTSIVQKYKIEVKEEPQFANETFDERRERLLECKLGVTLTPIRVPLVFKRRA
ncbi:cytochrome P450 [Rickenella mellea]|uniref:Cytochrome P450 n=1 Tax=Rickenella mellea TaxID=50990 RepID=A0A4Y7Q7D2_9AGAM|nr:cytochrome P450 [Rickenella mellea]